jgi:hypothetical protein
LKTRAMIKNGLTDAIWILSILISYIPIAVAFYKRKPLSPQLHILTIVLIISALSDSIGFWFVRQEIHTALLYNAQDFIQFILLSLIYYRITFTDNGEITTAGKQVFVSFSCFYLLSLLAISTVYQNPIRTHQNMMWTISAVILVIYACVYCYKLLVEVSTSSNLQFNFLVWVNSGILYYFSFSIFLFLMQSYIVSELTPDIARLTWSFNNINNIIKNVLITIGFASYSNRPAQQSN